MNWEYVNAVMVPERSDPHEVLVATLLRLGALLKPGDLLEIEVIMDGSLQIELWDHRDRLFRGAEGVATVILRNQEVT